MTQILRDTPATAQLLNYQNGDLTNFDATPSLAVTDGNGATVTTEAVSSPGTGIYQAIIPGQTNVSMLKAVWTAAMSTRTVVHTVWYEVVAHTLADEAWIRSYGAKATGTGPLASATDYTDAMIEEARERAVTRMEDWTERGWIGRYCRIEAAGTGTRTLWLADGEPRLADGTSLHRPGRLSDVRKIISASADGTALNTSNLRIDSSVGAVYRTDADWPSATSSNPRNIVIEYEYGLSGPQDGSERVLMALVAADLVPSLVSDRAMSMSTEFGIERYVTAGFGNAVTSLPEVNAWVLQHTRHLPVA